MRAIFYLELNFSAVRSLLRTFLSVCGFIVSGPYTSQNSRGKSNNSILNTFLHEKQGITWNTSLKVSIESGNLQS